MDSSCSAYNGIVEPMNRSGVMPNPESVHSLGSMVLRKGWDPDSPWQQRPWVTADGRILSGAHRIACLDALEGSLASDDRIDHRTLSAVSEIHG